MFFGKKKKSANSYEDIVKKANENLKKSQMLNDEFLARTARFVGQTNTMLVR